MELILIIHLLQKNVTKKDGEMSNKRAFSFVLLIIYQPNIWLYVGRCAVS